MPIRLTNTSGVFTGLVNTNGTCTATPVLFATAQNPVTNADLTVFNTIPACSVIGALATDIFDYLSPIINENNLTYATMWNQLINYLKCMDGNSACILTGPAPCCSDQDPVSISINMPGLLTVEGTRPSNGVNLVSTNGGDLSGANKIGHSDFFSHLLQM